ncbi:MAG: UPF0182 family protein [Blastocatellia bacterium]|jgi:uncharacterized membrane protein (UPF0182 family)
MNDEFFVDQVEREDRPPTRRRSPVLLFGLILLFFLFVWPAVVGFYTEWLWYLETGYQRVFSTRLVTQLALGAGGFVLGALLIWVNLRLALRAGAGVQRTVRYFSVNNERLELPDIAGFIRRWLFPIALVGGAWVGLQLWASWEIVQQFWHRSSFGEQDPIFGQDLSFYFFTLPVMEVGSAVLLQLLVLIIGGVLVLQLMPLLSGGRGKESAWISSFGRRHLLVLGALLMGIIAWRTRLEMYQLLYSERGPVLGASYTDLHALLPVLKVEFFLALLLAVVALASLIVARNSLLLVGIVLYGLVLVGGKWLYPSFVQRLSVAPNELVKETPYIQHNIAATRKSFGIDAVEEREISGEKTLTRADIDANRPTINNIRLWDHEPLLETFGQLQEIRTYYDFNSVDNDRYLINGELQQTMISPREINVGSLPNRNWINERLTFTHGFGITLGPANQVTTEGLPVLFTKDLPPVTTVPSLKVESPEIYYGELSHDPVYVRTSAQEFNYPAGEENVYTNYKGTGGVSLGSYWRRLVFATRFGDMKLLLSDDITAESRVLFHRNIMTRLSRIAPYLRFDQDPYLVISEGRLHWVADGYTVSNRYPYAQRVGGINYIRNSVKAVVDPYHGRVTLYRANVKDPILETWEKILPGTFRPLSEMSADLRAHLRYPEDIFSLQTAVYSTYHMEQPQVFYNKEDQWELATTQEADGRAKTMSPYYAVMKLPGEQKEEFIFMLPFTPRRKDNLASWMVARSDGENYGKLVVYRFPKQRLVYGPRQVMARINQDAEISRQLSLWDQRGSKAILGTLLVIPIEESLIYVQPLYLKANSGKIPELKRVIVAVENRIAMEETLDASLTRVFGAGTGERPPEGASLTEASAAASALPGAAAAGAVADTSRNSLAVQAQQAYDRAIQAQRNGDWARYGEELQRLGTLLQQMAQPEQPRP